MWSPWVPHLPTTKQRIFLDLNCREAFYGGAAGGGKSDALLMAALQYVDITGYAAILFRRTYADLALPEALIPRAEEWLIGTAAKWTATDHTWTFPSGATLTFGYLDTERNKYRYQSAAFQFVGFDELTQFSESQYLYLFSRLRRLEGSDIPLRMRSASNPGGIGHEWVKYRFIDSTDPERVWVPASLADNPHLDREEYRNSLLNLDPVTREQLLNGDWDILPQGFLFRREWLPIVQALPLGCERMRGWDNAGTEGGGDWSAGVLISHAPDGMWYIEDVVRGQWSPFARNHIQEQTAALDQVRHRTQKGHGSMETVVEQEGGSSGKESALVVKRELAGYDIHTESSTGSKAIRASAFAAQCEAGNVALLAGPWNKAYIDELTSFPTPDCHDDQVDATSIGFNRLARRRRAQRAATVIKR